MVKISPLIFWMNLSTGDLPQLYQAQVSQYAQTFHQFERIKILLSAPLAFRIFHDQSHFHARFQKFLQKLLTENLALNHLDRLLRHQSDPPLFSTNSSISSKLMTTIAKWTNPGHALLKSKSCESGVSLMTSRHPR